MVDWPFHFGELEAQVRAGGGNRGGAIRDAMPDQHRAFFEALPFVVVATLDREARDERSGHDDRAIRDDSTIRAGGGRHADPGWPVATIWSGAAGFVRAPDAHTLRIAGVPDPAEPAAQAFAVGAPFGMLGIELATKRRNRANGVIDRVDENGIVVAVRQSFGNCPQYIHPRELHAAAQETAPAEHFEGLETAAVEMIRGADTFFVATAARTEEATGGVDVSHRGGPRGFVRVEGNVLTIPDYKGNRYFNTLGNLVSQPRAALLFVDFASGDLLHLQGTTEIEWDGPEVRALEGAERLWRVRVQRGWYRPGALPLRWTRAHPNSAR